MWGRLQVVLSSCWVYLFVGKYEDGGLAQLVWLQHLVELLLGDGEALPVGAVHHQQDELRVGVVSVPGSAQGLLPAQVPHDEVDVVPDHLLHVAADGGRGVHHLVHQELVQDGRLARVVQTDQADFVLWIENW